VVVDISEIREIIQLFASSGIQSLELQRENFSLKLRLNRSVVFSAESVGELALPSIPSQAPSKMASPSEEGLISISSPIVGTFYAAPNPQSEAFVRVGSRVSSGQTLCIIEAMKLMNEIQSEHSGEVAAIHIANGQPVEYGQLLFTLRPV
jgi:acetyl-CoA carboxylase biotin carboxyl carrier protein